MSHSIRWRRAGVALALLAVLAACGGTDAGAGGNGTAGMAAAASDKPAADEAAAASPAAVDAAKPSVTYAP